MVNEDIVFTQNFFFEAFIIKNKVIGNITLGYFNAFKELDELPKEKKDEALKLLGVVFKNSNVVAGDLNSTPKKIKEILSYVGMYATILSTPSYMFPLAEVTEPVYIPSFDNFVVFDKEVSCKLETPIKITDIVSMDPRVYMREIDSPSDHIPIVGILTKNKKRVSVGIYNIADPMFWGKFYPKAEHGFDVSEAGEGRRLDKLEKFLRSFIEVSDIVFLTEVPANFVDRVTQLGHTHDRHVYIKDMQHIKSTRDESMDIDMTRISKNVLIIKKD